jgi:hypothetical protein
MDSIVCCSKSRSGAPREPTLSSATRHPPARFDSFADRGKRKPAESRHRVDRRDLPGERKIVAAHAGGSAGQVVCDCALALSLRHPLRAARRGLLRLAVRPYLGSNSISLAWRPVFSQAISVDPDSTKGSRIVSLPLEPFRIARSISSTGFCIAGRAKCACFIGSNPTIPIRSVDPCSRFRNCSRYVAHSPRS